MCLSWHLKFHITSRPDPEAGHKRDLRPQLRHIKWGLIFAVLMALTKILENFLPFWVSQPLCVLPCLSIWLMSVFISLSIFAVFDCASSSFLQDFRAWTVDFVRNGFCTRFLLPVLDDPDNPDSSSSSPLDDVSSLSSPCSSALRLSLCTTNSSWFVVDRFNFFPDSSVPISPKNPWNDKYYIVQYSFDG